MHTNRFRPLKEHPEYREEVALHGPGNLFDGKLDERPAAESFQSHIHGASTTEIYRILGNSYASAAFRAIPWYEIQFFSCQTTEGRCLLPRSLLC